MTGSEFTSEELAAINDFGSHATAFCNAIEAHADKSEEEFLKQMATLLARLYEVASHFRAELRSVDDDQGPATLVYGTVWSEAMDDLEPYLVKSDRYRALLTPYPEAGQGDEVIEGCLANNLCSVYAYLKPTLSPDPARPLTRVTIEAWRQFVGHKTGDDVLNALIAIHAALHDAFLFEEEDQ